MVGNLLKFKFPDAKIRANMLMFVSTVVSGLLC